MATLRQRLGQWVAGLAFEYLARRRPEELAQRLEERLGYHIMPPHYYSPIPEEEDFPPGFWEQRTELPGLTIDTEACLSFVEGDLAPFLAEFRDRFPIEETQGAPFWLINSVYMAVDAHVYYGLIRHLRPKQILEIGSGMSTRLAAAAVETNGAEGAPCQLTAVEPYPPEHLAKAAASGEFTLLQKKVQEVPLERFQELGAGDILFIDSSHVLREGNDVQYEFLEILPRLRDGVHVHVHDISLPRRYPRCYFDQKLYWNEQYLLQAFLAFNERFQVVWPGNLALLEYPERMLALFPEIQTMRAKWPASEATAFWMRVASPA